MDYTEYAEGIEKFATYPKDKELEYLALGLSGSSGGIADKLMKKIRSPERVDFLLTIRFISEIGDTYWYLFRVLTFFKTDILEIEKPKNYDCSGHTIPQLVAEINQCAGFISFQMLKTPYIKDVILFGISMLFEHLFDLCLRYKITPNEVLRENYLKLESRL